MFTGIITALGTLREVLPIGEGPHGVRSPARGRHGAALRHPGTHPAARPNPARQHGGNRGPGET